MLPVLPGSKLLSTSLQSCLDLANNWMTNNGLKLNADKTKCMFIRFQRASVGTPPLHHHLPRSQIMQVSSFKLLIVNVNDILTWSDHTKNVATKV